MAFMGPTILGGFAFVAEDEAERRAACAEAEALLQAGSISHNHILFRIYAIEACLRAGELDEAGRHAEALAGYCPEDGLDLVMFYADRGRVLACAGRSGATADLAEAGNRLKIGRTHV